MKYFPFFMELSKQSVLLIGGGEVAERKLDWQAFEPHICPDRLLLRCSIF